MFAQSNKKATFDKSRVSFSQAAPNASPLDVLHHGFRERLHTSLMQHLSGILSANKQLLPSLSQAWSVVSLDKRFNPAVYTAHWGLSDRIAAKDVKGCVAWLRILAELAQESSYAEDGYQILKYDPKNIVDKAMEEYVTGPEGPKGPDGIPAVMQEPEDAIFNEQKLQVQKALKILKDIDPDMYAEFEEYVSSVKLFSGRVARGMTSVRAFGSVYLRIPDIDQLDNAVEYYVSHITHEVSHLQLHAMMAFDPLILNPDSERFSAPIRPDLRPLYGIYHASFVLSRMIRVFRRWAAVDSGAYIKKELDMYRGMFQKGLATLGQHGKMTENGRLLLEVLPAVAEQD